MLSRAAFLGALAALSIGCVVPADDEVDAEDSATLSDELSVPVFIRSDQVHFGRAPSNTFDFSKKLSDDFSEPMADAEKVIDWLIERPTYEKPLYLGNIHTWVFDTDKTYRNHIINLATKVHNATHHTFLFYLEERNASHSPHPVSTAHGAALRAVAKHARLLCATYNDGTQTKSQAIARVKHWKDHYHGTLGLPMKSLLVDIDLSQTPGDFYYGTRGHLTQFNKVVKWTLNAAYNQRFGGFHSIGNVGGTYGTERAADSTYDTLNAAWDALVAAHPEQEFSGL